MKKSTIVLAAGLMLLAASCNKEESFPKTFTAGMEQSGNGSKMYLDGHDLKWDGSEQVKVFTDGAMGAIFNVTPQTDATWATLTYESGAMMTGTYTAIYPAAVATAATTVTLPTVQQSTNGSLDNMPMIAEAASTTFQFHNLCGVMKVHLQQAGVSVKSIKVTASSPVAGAFTVGGTMAAPTLTAASGNTQTSVTLSMTSNQDITDGHDFYIYLPADTYSSVSLEVTNAEDGTCTKSASNITIGRNQIHTITVTNMEFETPDLLSGEFSINANGDKVRFSKGNLQYQASTGTWRFAANQYDYIGEDNENISDTYSGWIDLFGWSTASTYYGVSASGIINTYSGDFVDWGTAFGASSAWRTLSHDEWSYLCYSRTNASSLYGVAQIQMSNGLYRCGVIFLPDNWDSNNGCSFTAGMSSTAGDWSLNEYTLAQWETMESNGAIFLPAAGYRYNHSNSVDYSSGNSFGWYWSSTAIGSTSFSAFCLVFWSTAFSTAGAYYYDNGYSVRLVQDVE